ncbi:MAG: hypothetical protein ACAH95_02500 [Fimbriimonas sp.]
MNNKIGRIAVGAGLAVLAACAVAQDVKPVGLSVRAGLFMPTDSNTRAGGSGWFSAGVEYKVMDRMTMSGAMDQVTVSLDFASRNNFRIVPLLVNYVHHLQNFYVTAGVGVSFSRRPVGLGVEDRARFGYQLGIGHDFQTAQFPLFVEAKFFGNERAELNGFGAYVGVRF